MLKRRSLFPINGNQVFRWWDALDNQGKSRSPILQPWSFHLKLERAKKKEPRKGEEEKKMKRRKKKKGRRYIWIPCGIHDPNSHQTQQGVAIFFFSSMERGEEEEKTTTNSPSVVWFFIAPKAVEPLIYRVLGIDQFPTFQQKAAATLSRNREMAGMCDGA